MEDSVYFLLIIGVLIFILTQNRKNKHNERNNESKKEVIHNLEGLKSLQEKTTSKQTPEASFNNIDYELPNINIIDNEQIKELVKKNNNIETIIPLGLFDNDYYYESLESLPNLIVGGTVMSGKSSFIHTIIGTILLTKKPYETKLLICDSKKIEYNQYNGIPHLLAPIISDPKMIEVALIKMNKEINKRIDLLNSSNKKTISEYNNSLSDEKRTIPSYLIIIDDYDMISNNEIDENITFIAKNGWRVNTYLIIVSTHPSSEVISSSSKSLIPARLCFKVTSSKDSMLFLDDPIASKLAGIGKAAYVSRKVSVPKQLEVQILNDDEIKRLIEWSMKQQKVLYNELLSDLDDVNNKGTSLGDDPLYDQVVDFVVKTQKASASLLQRKFKFGYSKAAAMIDKLEEDGIIGPATGNSKPRLVLVQFRDEEK